MKLFLASLVALGLALVRLSYADTGDHYVTGQVRVGDSLRLDGTLSGTGWNLAIDSAKLAAGAVDSEKILDASVDTGKHRTDSVTGAKILNATIGTNKLAEDAVNTGKLAFSVNVGASDSGKILCIKGGNASSFGLCAGYGDGSGYCNCQ